MFYFSALQSVCLVPGVADVSQGAPIPLYEPVSDGKADNIFISKSYDATSHFETTTDDVKDIYHRATGEELKVEGLRDVQIGDQ